MRIPQADGATDLDAWQQSSWCLSPHVVDPPPENLSIATSPQAQDMVHSCCHKALPLAADSKIAVALREGLDANVGEEEQEGVLEQKCFTTSEDSSFTQRDSVELGTGTVRKAAELIFTPARAAKKVQTIPQVDGPGDGRTQRLGSSLNRGRGRLSRSRSPALAEQQEAIDPSQRYGALSVQQSQSPEKPFGSPSAGKGIAPLLNTLLCNPCSHPTYPVNQDAMHQYQRCSVLL